MPGLHQGQGEAEGVGLVVKSIEGGVCPYCKAYAKVYGRKAHEPVPQSTPQ